VTRAGRVLGGPQDQRVLDLVHHVVDAAGVVPGGELLGVLVLQELHEPVQFLLFVLEPN